MKTVKLISLSLSNWRGQTRTITPNGESVVITGTNHSGKSTVMNAFLWCVLGTDNLDRNNYLLFDNTIEHTHDTAVPAEVRMELSVDGQPVTLKRIATQGWVRRRGSDTYERSGADNYSYYVDGIERTATQYKSDIEDIFGANTDTLKIILNLNYFLNLKWDVQRKYLGEIIGEVTESDFKGDYSDIIEDLRKYSIEGAKAKYKSSLKPAKENMDKLPVAIEALQSSLPSLDGVEEAKKMLDTLKKELADVEKQVSDRAEAVKAITDKRVEEIKEIARLEESLTREGLEYSKQMLNLPEVKALADKIAKIKTRNLSLNSEKSHDEMTINSLRRQMDSLIVQCKTYSLKDASLREEIKKLKETEFVSEACPYCGQELPESKVEEARIKFYEKKAQERERIVTLGKSNKEVWNDTLAQIDGFKAKIEALESKTYEIESTDALETAYNEMLDSQAKFESSLLYKEKMAEIEQKKANLTEIPSANSNDDLNEKKNLIYEQINECHTVMGSVSVRNSMLQNIEEQKEMLKMASVEAAKYEGYLALLAKYEREKAEIIRQRVNSLFDYCDVQMETLDKSGASVPTCIINDKGGVDARVTNTASGYNCRIDISKAFAKYHNLSLPIFVDNAEAVNDNCLLRTDGQMIELKVSETPFQVNNLT